jgi:hypothetical protein
MIHVKQQEMEKIQEYHLYSILLVHITQQEAQSNC